jgi:hypothetical protein
MPDRSMVTEAQMNPSGTTGLPAGVGPLQRELVGPLHRTRF